MEGTTGTRTEIKKEIKRKQKDKKEGRAKQPRSTNRTWQHPLGNVGEKKPRKNPD